jgi:hypothetical protein
MSKRCAAFSSVQVLPDTSRTFTDSLNGVFEFFFRAAERVAPAPHFVGIMKINCPVIRGSRSVFGV